MSSSTQAAPQALTTPFVPPQSCADQFITTTIYSDFTTTTVLASVPAHPRFSACQPPGWDSGGDNNSILHFSPAVCPSGWTAHALGGYESQAVSTAHCCSSGFALIDYYPFQSVDGISPQSPCVANMTNTSPPSATAFPARSTAAYHLRVHNAWHISWEASDMPSLSPTPPPLPLCETSSVIWSWVPGATVEPGAYLRTSCDDRASGSGSGSGLPSLGVLMVLVVVVPVVFLMILCSCVWVCCRRRRRREREAREAHENGGGPLVRVLGFVEGASEPLEDRSPGEVVAK
ncbi:hypothetical protein N658DRAFT_501295 [Parathielavia hyrcaniae]|uniref:Uncharacterized protein n=1 Tax=Parathielavia hyrcaniae TaxID=113614 RepID=A0AAN6SXR6_9PEZI|nr:hypothetical protein N658DRAFT_501295 [Parathielavia hyrcaniae]